MAPFFEGAETGSSCSLRCSTPSLTQRNSSSWESPPSLAWGSTQTLASDSTGVPQCFYFQKFRLQEASGVSASTLENPLRQQKKIELVGQWHSAFSTCQPRARSFERATDGGRLRLAESLVPVGRRHSLQ